MAEKGLLDARTAVAVILKGIDKDFGGLGERISKETAGGLETNIGTTVSRLLGQASSPAFEEYKKALRTFYGALESDQANAIVGGISTSTQKLFDAMHGLSVEGVTGDLKGFEAGSKQLFDAGVRMAESAIDGTATAQQSKSPSKVFYQLGMWGAQGYFLGIQDGLKKKGFSGEIEKLILENAKRVGVDPDVIRAIIMQESGGKVGAVSPKGAKGLMQLMPDTARHYSVSDPFNPAQNIEGGTRYFADLLERFGGDQRLALAAYMAPVR